jgi:membrane protein implicated in regulation of membrane protease activity
MIAMHPYELALAVAVALGVLEVITGTFIFLGFCLGSLAAAVAEFLSGEFSFGRDALLFAAVGVLAVIALRFAFGHPGDTTHAKGDVNDY